MGMAGRVQHRPALETGQVGDHRKPLGKIDRLVNGPRRSHRLLMTGFVLRENATNPICGQGHIAVPKTDDQETGRLHVDLRRIMASS